MPNNQDVLRVLEAQKNQPKRKKKKSKRKYNQYHVRLLTEEHKQKYVGNSFEIVLRSSWEKDFFMWLMHHPSVKKVSSEEIVIPYTSKVDNRRHRYYMDFYFYLINRQNIKKEFLVEVKPYAQTQKPRKDNVYEFRTYLTNISKWEAAINYSIERGYDFRFLTDDPKNKGRYKLWHWKEIGLPLKQMEIYNIGNI